MTDITVTKVDKIGVLPTDKQLGFGQIFTDHMFVMDYETGKGWHSPRIVPYGEFAFVPATIVFHYGQAIFEGMKAFRGSNNQIAVFRTKHYLNRFNRSAGHLCIPPIDVDEVQAGLFKLLDLEKDWVPSTPGTSLYIRPFIISTDGFIGVKVASTYKLFIILSPVGAYYAHGFNPVSIKVEDKYVRATKGGLGQAKTPANYAMSLPAQAEAYKEGFDQVLWLDAVHREYVEEVGTMNIFFKINGEIITPELNGSILGGITRQTVLELARNWGFKTTERQISIVEVYEAHAKGELEEVFGTGTAAVISPVGELSWKGRKMVINHNQTGEFSQRLFDYVTGVQNGIVPDEFGWMDIVSN
ncbi:branched-chain amino acid aminotransferase [Desulfosporosinus sp.]|uniref:branched-chain amino acid aminotransferase n=1 Tax=Desulfosporosinus sp. TaxID=157907 RepID=UPI000E9CA46C|nr:branched-chain amino acid aminotransferase [Desulfosporosinus sp.]MBC2723220.1 branched-chain amino acid aminotransferase [Desulfosporosinus sp.]MBC2729131.1 branched-chain amino acid aminotransferase [Desulfosporosinus sp.]HBV86176.1 branched chain amino acid aminotransferase [Desulfosporosinus sp.]